MKKKFFNESGQTLIFVALGMTVMLGFVGFATDVGVLLHEQREVQTAADSAAIAGALEALSEGSVTGINSNISAAATADSALNGFADKTNGATVNVVMAPNITVPVFNTAGYVQATVTQNTPDFFMKLFGFNSMNVSATAIATELGEKAPCLIVENKGGANPAIYLSGNSLVAAQKCGIPVNGNILFNGGKAQIQAGNVTAYGTISGNAGVNISGPSAEVPYPVASDPALDSTLGSNADAITNGTCPTGLTCYFNFMGGNLTAPSNGTLQLKPGIYYFNEDVTLSGNIDGTAGVMFYIDGTHKFDYAANGTATLDPYITSDASSPYYNVLIDAPNDGPWTACASGKAKNTNPGELFFDFGSSDTTINGIVYAPNAQLFVQDSGATMAFNADMVIGNICMQSATFSINGLSAPSYSTKVGLVY